MPDYQTLIARLEAALKEGAKGMGLCSATCARLYTELRDAAHALSGATPANGEASVSTPSTAPEQEKRLLRFLVDIRKALLSLNIDGCDVWNHWMDEDGSLSERGDALLREASVTPPSEGEKCGSCGYTLELVCWECATHGPRKAPASAGKDK